MKQIVNIFFLFLSFSYGFTQNKISNTPKNDALIKDFGLKLSQKNTSGNSNYFLTKLNSDAFYAKTILHDKNNKALTKFNKKFKATYNERLASFPQEMSDALKNGELYNFVSYHFDQQDKTYHMIFRYYTSQFGLDYHDYRILKNEKEFYIDDIFVFSSHQKLSETLKLFYLNSVPKKYLTPLFKKASYTYLLMLKNFIDASTDKKYAKAQQHINALHQQFKRKNRFIATLRLENAHYIGEESYFDVMEDILTHFYADPSIQLTAMQYHYANIDYDEVEKCINSLKNHTQDPFLDFEKGNLFFKKKDYESAAIFYKNMLKNYPNFTIPKFSLLVVYDRLHAFDKAINLLDDIIKTTSYTKNKLIENIKKRLPELYSCEQFKQWQKS